ncbi:unnamed protein product [Durusdinium trenchii]|uniref:Uncharacterized protein n=1 Tax=Durusdinium trenchii TaxID=1381693 RepID=A0ABP0QT21_9DINO
MTKSVRAGAGVVGALLVVTFLYLCLQDRRQYGTGRALQSSQVLLEPAPLEPPPLTTVVPSELKVTNQSQWTAPLSDAGQGTVEAPSGEVHSSMRPSGEDLESLMLLEMTHTVNPNCHCPSVLNGYHKPADRDCLQNCSRAFYLSQIPGPRVSLKNGPLVFNEHEEL